MHRLLDQRGINSVHTIKPRKAQYGPFPPGVPDGLIRALARQGIKKLYAHQSEAAGHIMAGRNVIITTGTSSGKSMVYTIPVFSALFDNPQARALYVSPAKALGQNQAGAMNELAAQIDWPRGRPVITACDGDTPQNERRGIINGAGAVITTPDFIHACLLPRHRHWAGFFSGLQYVIIDEAHVLKGVMGCHCLQVFRRLRRICDYYGTRPVFILCTATIANPVEFARNLTGLPFRAVTSETSAAGEKTVVFYEPPTYETEDGRTRRRLTHFEAARAVGRYVENGRRTIMFCRSRRVVESAYRKLQENFPGTSGQVTTYKGTYSPQFRREIESRLFTGKLKGVITTNALELGINVGDLDTCILAGFAGSISSTWQQAGRVGRKGQKSLIVLMANEDPLDFYIVRHPQYFFGQPFEKAVVSEKMQFLVDHLPLAAAELPLRKEDTAYWEQDIYYEAVKLLLKHGRLRLVTDRPKSYGPAVDPEFFSLRGESENYQTLDPGGRIVEQYNYDDVLKDAYPGAILPVYDRTYLVDEIDFDRKIIRLKNLPQKLVGCYTRAVINSRIDVEKVERTRQEDNFTVYAGVLNIHKSFDGYTLVDVINETKNMYEPKQPLKPIDFPTSGIWLDIDLSSLVPALKYEAVHALKHLLHIVIPLEVMCERNDLGASMLVEGDNARIFIYDNYAGGVGLAESVFGDIKRILERCYELVTGCGCTGGCPSCIIIPQCLQANERLNKEGVIKLLAGILGKEKSQMHFRIRLDQENATAKAKSRADIRLEARALEMEIQEYARAVDYAGEHLPAAVQCVKSIYGRKLIKQETTLLAVLYLLISFTGKPVPGRVLKQAVAQCSRWSAIYGLSLRNLRDRGLVTGLDEQFALLPGVEKDIDDCYRKAVRQ